MKGLFLLAAPVGPIAASPLHALLSGPGLLPVISDSGMSLGAATLTVQCFRHITLPPLDCKSPAGSTLAGTLPKVRGPVLSANCQPQTHLTDTNDSTGQSPDMHCKVAVPAARFSGHQGPLPLLLTPQLFLCTEFLTLKSYHEQGTHIGPPSPTVS